MDELRTRDPIEVFREWLAEAEAAEPNDPTAMAVATVDAAGNPSVRMLLLKGLDQRGFAFYTNFESRKGRELLAQPRAALCFHWKSLRRQVRVEGPVEIVSDAEADAYFRSRARVSQIGAVASDQSRPLDSRATLFHVSHQHCSLTFGLRLRVQRDRRRLGLQSETMNRLSWVARNPAPSSLPTSA